jgi:ADP-ribosylation factor-like protein 2
LRPFWRNYFEKTDTLVWVVDATAIDRLPDCKMELDKVLDEDRLKGAGLLILVNKLDIIPEQEQKETVVRIRALLGLPEDSDVSKNVKNESDAVRFHESKVLGCSAFTGMNLDVALDWIVDEVKARLYLLE